MAPTTVTAERCESSSLTATCPPADRNSGSLRLFRIIQLMLAEGYTVTVLGRDSVSQQGALDALGMLGVQQVIPVDPEHAGSRGLTTSWVAPYRGEGFAMPVLEAMACGLPVIVTAGGPQTSSALQMPVGGSAHPAAPLQADQLAPFTPTSTPWMLEPEGEHLVELLREAAAAPLDRQNRGRAARTAAEKLSWEAVAERYMQRIASLAGERPKLSKTPSEPFPMNESVDVRILATPAWHGKDRIESHRTRIGSACQRHVNSEPAHVANGSFSRTG